MRFFFRSRQFKILITVVAVIVSVSVATVVISGFVAPQNNIVGSLLTPIQQAITSVSNTINNFNQKLSSNNKLMLENQQLKEQIADLTEDLMDYEESKKENDFYKDYLEIKDANKDFQFENAMLVSKDSKDPYGSFTINKGSLNGISQHDPVITGEGLVGYISEVGLSYAKVTTIFDPELSLGAYDKRTRDVGAVSGTLSLADKGCTKFYNLTRNCTVTVGDYIVSSGGGIFPEGLIIGTVHSVNQEKQNTSLYAVVKPTVDFEDLSDMMVITYFSGQGSIVDKAGEK